VVIRMPDPKIGGEVSMSRKTIMHFRVVGLLSLIGVVLIGMAEGFSLSPSFDVQKPLTQLRSRPEINAALTARPGLGKASTLKLLTPYMTSPIFGGRERLTDSSAFGMNRALSVAPVAQTTRKRTDSIYQRRKVQEWRTAVVQHNAGEPDSAALTVGSWSEEDLDLVIQYITKLASQPVKTTKRTLARASTRRILQLTEQEAKRGDLNRLLKQGALLHTDIALLELETREVLVTSRPVAGIHDGHVALMPRNLHWEVARRLIDSVSPSPSQDPMVRQWYIATIAHMQSRRLLAYAKPNIESALGLFPSDDRILFYAGVLHETWASPFHQNILLPPLGRLTYDSKESELKQAHEFFRKSIEENPSSAETHLRLGRVLGLLGLHHQAVAELQQAAASIKDPQLLYYKSLYLGFEFAMLSRQSEARDQYELAAMLYPAAQSPLLALSQLARSSDNVEGAFLALQRVFALARTDSWEDDPWWIYDLSHVRDAAALVSEMQETFALLPR